MKAKTILDILYAALRQSRDARINDVVLESDDTEIILDTDDGNETRRWVISENGIVETDAE